MSKFVPLVSRAGVTLHRIGTRAVEGGAVSFWCHRSPEYAGDRYTTPKGEFELVDMGPAYRELKGRA